MAEARQGAKMNSFYHKLAQYRLGWAAPWIILLLLVSCQTSSPPPSPTVSYTIPVAPEFIDFYTLHGGTHVFGEPLDWLMEDPESGRLVQYFSRMRLEFEGNLSDTQRPIDRVSIYPLGEWAYTGVSAPSVATLGEVSQERFFPETGFAVRNGFLEFYEQNHGDVVFGPPISELLDEGGKRVQYFRNARLEWQPAASMAYRVQPGLLGRAHYDHSGYLGERAPGQAQPQPATGIAEARVNVSVRSPIVYQNETQQVFVQVETLARQPVEGARIVLVVSYGNVIQEIELGMVDDTGFLRQEIDMSSIPAGEKVHLQARAYNSAGTLLGEGVALFRTWW